MNTSTPPFVSIVMPARNEEKFIKSALEAVFELDYPKESYEVLVVNNHSNDRTVEIASQFPARIIDLSAPNVGAVRNAGVREAQGEILAFLDADCVPDKNWLRAGVRALEQEGGIVGSTYGLPENAHWSERAWFESAPTGRVAVTHINAGNLFIERTVFNELGGFDETRPSGEDYELAQRCLKIASVISDDSIRVIHLGNPKTLKDFFRRERWHGLGALGSLKNNLADKPFWATLVFLLATLGSLVGFLSFLIYGAVTLLQVSMFSLIGVLVLTVLYRIRGGATWNQFAPLILLYAVYYSGRSVALINIAAGNLSYVREK